MPRTSRKRSETGFYHVILRGNGKQNLFETDKDRAAFMEAARSSFSRDSVTLIAWCLMDNHVHLIIDDPLDRISTAIQRVTSTYAMYFNHTFGHSGHVFEGRYGSVPIIDDEQLRAAVKYVHNNPLKGMGITPESLPVVQLFRVCIRRIEIRRYRHAARATWWDPGVCDVLPSTTTSPDIDQASKSMPTKTRGPRSPSKYSSPSDARQRASKSCRRKQETKCSRPCANAG